MLAYYNENEPFAAAWLRQLIARGLIAPGHVDERDIRDVQPGDLAGYERCHFFAGIAGWDYALQLAGWDGPVWTGSCPCQPFSSAGKGEGFADPRHLWPAWFRLIRECRPPVVFGEQVASADGLAWIDHVSTDVEAEDYAFGAADLCAAGVRAPHLRQRLFYVAESAGAGRRPQPQRAGVSDGRTAQEPGRLRDTGALADATEPRSARGAVAGAVKGSGRAGTGEGDQPARGSEPQRESPLYRGSCRTPACRWFGAHHDGMHRLGDARRKGLEVGPGPEVGPGTVRHEGAPAPAPGPPGEAAGPKPGWRHGADPGGHGRQGDQWGPRQGGEPEPARCGGAGPWSDVRWVYCRDDKWRPVPVEPSLFPLASGVPNRVGTLRGAGNSIVSQVAAEFISAYREAVS